MKERITFIHGAEDAFDPKQIKVEQHALKISSLTGSREDRLTFGFDELPQEIWLVLKQCYELHLRWSSTGPYLAVDPYGSRVTPGLHVFYTPQKGRPATLLCPLLKKIFGDELKCSSPEESFTLAPIHLDKQALSAAYNYYQPLPSLEGLLIYAREKICAQQGKTCEDRIAGLGQPDYVDIDYDSQSQTLEIKTFQEKGSWSDNFKKARKEDYVEVGVLANETPVPPDPENLSLGGFTTVVGEDTKPSRVLFTFPSRHHALSPSQLSSRYTAAFVPPTGLHPTLRLSFDSRSHPTPEKQDEASCALYSYLTLPSVLFPDKYQLSAPLFLASKNLGPVLAIAGETDLEAPDWAVSRWGSSMLIELAPPQSQTSDQNPSWHADIPLHLRYLRAAPGGYAEAQMPWPVVFWACNNIRKDEEEIAGKMKQNPFDRTNLGYEASFAPGTFFYHLQPFSSSNISDGGGLVERLTVPVLDSERTAAVLEPVTAAVILGGVFWVLWVLFRVVTIATPTPTSTSATPITSSTSTGSRGTSKDTAATPRGAAGKRRTK